MTEINFYHLLTTPLERALPKLMEKALGADMRAVVRVDSDVMADKLNDALWEYDTSSFLPHGSMRDPYPERQPIYITTRDENPNDARLLVIADGSSFEEQEGIVKLLDMFDGHDDTAVKDARERWKIYKEKGYTLKYIQQQKNGGWKEVKQ